MAVTITATPLGAYSSKVTAAAMSSAAGSVDILTIPHGLGTTPDFVYPVLRSVSAIASGGAPVFEVTSYNGSQAVIAMRADPVATNAVLDVLIEYRQSISR